VSIDALTSLTPLDAPNAPYAGAHFHVPARAGAFVAPWNADESEESSLDARIEEASRVEQASFVHVERQTTEPEEEASFAPAERQSFAPAERQSSAPAERQSSAPAERQSSVPAERQSSAPAERQTTEPAEEASFDPFERQTTESADEESSALVEKTTEPAEEESARAEQTTVASHDAPTEVAAKSSVHTPRQIGAWWRWMSSHRLSDAINEAF
jgi:hypothetical protein